ncbi:MAG: hypothetical protein ACYTFI_19185 [Planctomycetota bacterium]|jgi:hypothetical protein
MPESDSYWPRPPRFPYVGALLCAACVGAAVWTWMSYAYVWDVTPAGLFPSREAARRFPPWRSEFVNAAISAERGPWVRRMPRGAISILTGPTPNRMSPRPSVREPLLEKADPDLLGCYVRVRGVTLKIPRLAARRIKGRTVWVMTGEYLYEFLDPADEFCAVGIRGAYGAESPVIREGDGTAYCYGRTIELPGCRISIDPAAGRLAAPTIAGLVVGAMGVFVFASALRHWLGERTAFAIRPAGAAEATPDSARTRPGSA